MKILENPHLNHLVFIIIVVIVAWLVAKIIKMAINRQVKKSSVDMNMDPTKFYFLKNAVNAIMAVVAIIVIFYSIPSLRNLGISLFAGAGILAAIVGFASQQAFSNIVGGIFLVIFKPFKVGDVIRVGDHFGLVEDITLRHTVINSLENRRIVIPNSTISDETILNSSLNDEMICAFIELGISYDSDIDRAFSIMVEEAMKHPSYIDNRTHEQKEAGMPSVVTRVLGFGDSSVNLRAQVWANDHLTAFNMKCDLYKSIKERFDREGIEIPFPYRTIVYKDQPKS